MKRGSIPSAIPLTSPANPSTTNGQVIDVSLIFSISAQLVATGSAAGTFKMQVSDDSGPDSYMDTFIPTNWSDLSGASISISGAGVFVIPKVDLSYNYVRFVYTSTGTGTIVANAKTLSA